MILYLFFLVSVLLFGSFLIGPFTGRVWMVMVMFSYLLISSFNNKVYKRNVYISLFILFILFLIIAQTMNGDMESYGIKWILANHFVCIVAFFATIYITRINTQNKMDTIIFTIMVLLVIDSVVTIMQYGNEPIGWAINLFLMQGRNEEVMAFQESHQMLETLAGVAKTPGIFDSSVENGLFLGSCGILSFYFFLRDSKIMKIIALVVMGLTMLACFMCQERAAMLVLVASVAYLFFKTFNRKTRWISVVVFVIIAFIMAFNFDFSKVDYGRFEEVGLFTNEARKNIWSYFIPYILNNFLFGGAESFRAITGALPHNFFFNAFVFGGLLGGITIIVLYVMLVMKGYKLLISRKSSSTLRVLAIAFLSILAQSLVHNASIITGDALTFLLFGLIMASEMNNEGGNSKIIKKVA